MEKLTDLKNEDILLYLGHRGQEIDDAMTELIETCKKELLKKVRPRVMLRRLVYEDGCFPEVGFAPAGTDIRAHLSGCAQAVLMAATIGSDVDGLIRRAEVADMTRAVIYDACATSAIEAVCDGAEEELRSELAKEGLYLTGRFSPGYGDMPITQQQDICRILDTARRMGLTVTPSCLLLPMKSVTALMGISDRPVHASGGCAVCSQRDTCTFRKRD